VAFFSAISLALSGAIRGPLGILILFSMINTLRQHYFFLSNRSVRAVGLNSTKSRLKPLEIIPSDDSDESWWLELCSDQPAGNGVFPQHPAKLIGSYLVTPWLVILNFRLEGRMRVIPVLIFRDSTNPERLRRLRVLLLH
jgi:hypothetical protein